MLNLAPKTLTFASSVWKRHPQIFDLIRRIITMRSKTTFNAESFNVREATLGDSEDVAAIDTNILGGFDHLPKIYETFLKDPLRTSFILQKHGKIVGFAQSYVVDDFETLAVQAIRVSESARTGGLWAYFRAQVVFRTLAKYPTLNTISVTTREKDLVMSRIKSGSDKWPFSFICTRPCLTATLKSDGNYDSNFKLLKSPIRNIERDELKSILMDSDNQSKLFPDKRILISWASYKLLPSNADVIGNLCHEIIGTFEEKDSVRCSTISFGHYYKTKVGLRYDAEIYGNDIQEILDHAQRQVQLSYRHHTYGKHCVWFYLPVHIDQEIVQREIAERIPIEEKLGILSCSLFEREVHPNSKL